MLLPRGCQPPREVRSPQRFVSDPSSSKGRPVPQLTLCRTLPRATEAFQGQGLPLRATEHHPQLKLIIPNALLSSLSLSPTGRPLLPRSCLSTIGPFPTRLTYLDTFIAKRSCHTPLTPCTLDTSGEMAKDRHKKSTSFANVYMTPKFPLPLSQSSAFQYHDSFFSSSTSAAVPVISFFLVWRNEKAPETPSLIFSHLLRLSLLLSCR